MDTPEHISEPSMPRVKIVGVGTAGIAALARVHASGLREVSLCALDTDAGALALSPVEEKLMIGAAVTRGLSAGGDVEVGRRAAESSRAEIAAMLGGAHLVFVLAGLGGGTACGALPVIAQIASQAGAVVVAFVTLPFVSEAAHRQRQARETLKILRVCGADSVFTMPSDLLLQSIGTEATAPEAFQLAAQWICRGVGALCRSFSPRASARIEVEALQKMLVGNAEKTLFLIGRGEGDHAFDAALENLAACPLLRVPKADSHTATLLAFLCAKPNFDIRLLNRMSEAVAKKFPFHATLLVCAFGYESLGDAVEIYLFGTGEAVRPKSLKPATSAKVAPVLQEEFGFAGDDVRRGYFDGTAPSLFRGEDLDVPTYLRRNIKIVLN